MKYGPILLALAAVLAAGAIAFFRKGPDEAIVRKESPGISAVAAPPMDELPGVV